MSKSECRWGILGTAAIARKLWNAIAASEAGRVTAVASRSENRATKFIQECAAETPMDASTDSHQPQALGQYDALINHPDVDVVYIPLPTSMRKQYVIDAAKAGKHVLCEKPAAVNASDLKEMIQACESAGVQFMDGVMFDHSIRWSDFREAIHDDRDGLGKIRRIQTHFSFPGDAEFQNSNIRTNAQLEPHGCLGDLGWYCIRFTLGITGGNMPTAVQAHSLKTLSATDSDGSVPGEFSAEMFFDNDCSADFFCSFLTANQQTAIVSGDQGYATLDDFVLPFMRGETRYQIHRNRLDIEGGRWDFRRSSATTSIDEYPSAIGSAQEVRMVERFNEIVASGKLEPAFAETAFKTQQILDACRRSDAAEGQRVAIS